YGYQENLAPQSTSEIAQHFASLTVSQKQRIQNFCERELIQRYQKLEMADESYFHQKRLWKLSVYDSDSLVNVYLYELHDSSITRVQSSDQKSELAWATEIPAARLYGALESGESLTSIYLRINAERFNDEVEKDLAD